MRGPYFKRIMCPALRKASSKHGPTCGNFLGNVEIGSQKATQFLCGNAKKNHADYRNTRLVEVTQDEQARVFFRFIPSKERTKYNDDGARIQING